MRAFVFTLLLASCGPTETDTDTAGGTDADGDGHTSDVDCDDHDATIHPEAQEVCNELDDDCDGNTDEDATDAATWYRDDDGDGYGSDALLTQACAQPSGHVDVGGDCDDQDEQRSPDAVDVCDGVDNDCDGEVDYEIDVPADYALITDAIAAASAGDRVCVLAGTYVETVTLDKEIILEGEDRDTTVIDAGGSAPVLSIDESGSPAVVSGFTLTGGLGSSAVALRSTSSDALIFDLLLEDNAVEGEGQCVGALMSVDGGSPVMDGIEIRDNAVVCPDVWGLVYVGGGARAELNHVRLTGNTITADREVHGGFTVYSGSELILENLVIAGNAIGASSGGAPAIKAVALASEGGSISVTNATIHGNIVDAGAGVVQAGVVHDTSGGISLANVSISSNAVSGASIVATVNQGSNDYSYCNIHDQAEPAFASMSDPRGAGGNIEGEPGFADVSATDPARWDMTLQAGSGMRDQGLPHLSDADGSRSDIGAYGGPGSDHW